MDGREVRALGDKRSGSVNCHARPKRRSIIPPHHLPLAYDEKSKIPVSHLLPRAVTSAPGGLLCECYSGVF